MTRNIFIDLDGTLIDPRQRLYALFQELVPASRLSFDEYWKIKRRRVDQNRLLGEWFSYDEGQVAIFKEEWFAKVEEHNRMRFDVPFPRVFELLDSLGERHHLHLVTARQDEALVNTQLQTMGLRDLFEKVLVTRQVTTKAELIRKSIVPNATDILIGDTGEDILTARDLGVIAVAVCSGSLCREVLSTYQPDFLMNDITEIHETGLV